MLFLPSWFFDTAAPSPSDEYLEILDFEYLDQLQYLPIYS